MKKLAVLSVIAFLACSVCAKAADKPFDIYTDKDAPGNHFIPAGWMGDAGDIKFDDKSADAPASGTTCIKLTYTAKKSAGQGWAGIYWQSAEGNWGDKQTGFDLSGYNKLVFKAKGAKGGEVITSVKVGGIIQSASGEKVAYPDSTTVESGPIQLTNEWKEYSINLVGQKLNYINGGLVIVFNAAQAGGEQVVYLDDIQYVNDPTLKKAEAAVTLPFYVYSDSNSLDNHFIPSGWMPATASQDIKVDNTCKDAPHSGTTCIKVTYKNVSGTRWAGVYWQQPANNWGTVPNAGYNLTGAKKLTFWAKGANGGEVINEFKMGGIASGEFIDTDSAGIGPIRLTKDWQKYEIDLAGRDLSYIIGGFCCATNIDVNSPDGITFYLDDIQYE